MSRLTRMTVVLRLSRAFIESLSATRSAPSRSLAGVAYDRVHARVELRRSTRESISVRKKSASSKMQIQSFFFEICFSVSGCFVRPMTATPAQLELEGSTAVLPLPLSTPLDFDLPRATFLFLQQIGISSSTTTVQQAHRSSLLREDYQSTLVRRPLVNINDATLLLSIIPNSLLDLHFAAPKPPSPTAATRTRLLDTLARLALEPSLTLPVMRRYRPFAMHFWGKWLEMLGADVTTGQFRQRSEEEMVTDEQLEQERLGVHKVYRAMISVMSVFENCFP